MSTVLSSYRLEAPRPSSRPPSIAIYNSSFTPRSFKNAADDELLYELPSPPISRVGSPKSPSSAGRRALSPPASRARCVTPVPPEPQLNDLEQFAERCRQWYFKQDDEAGRLVMQTINSLPSSQRATYSRLQASVRADYHATLATRRNAEFLARLRSMIPGGSLAPHARAEPASPAARRERAERLTAFIGAWCTPGMPGTTPLFEGLYAVLRLQSLPAALGGGGGRRLEWEVDDAAFKEAAGREFTLAALDILKGVLGFDDARAAKRSDSWSRPGSAAGTYAAADRRLSLPLTAVAASPAASPTGGIASTTSRPRAPSDPFLDRQPALSHSLGSSAPRSPPTPTRELPPQDAALLVPNAADALAAGSDANDYTRVWIAPDLPDAELTALLRLFPPFISQRALPRFPARREDTHADADVEADADADAEAVRYGTGRISLGSRRRSGGFGASWWARFVAWWRRLFTC